MFTFDIDLEMKSESHVFMWEILHGGLHKTWGHTGKDFVSVQNCI